MTAVILFGCWLKPTETWDQICWVVRQVLLFALSSVHCRPLQRRPEVECILWLICSRVGSVARQGIVGRLLCSGALVVAVALVLFLGARHAVQ